MENKDNDVEDQSVVGQEDQKQLESAELQEKTTGQAAVTVDLTSKAEEESDGKDYEENSKGEELDEGSTDELMDQPSQHPPDRVVSASILPSSIAAEEEEEEDKKNSTTNDSTVSDTTNVGPKPKEKIFGFRGDVRMNKAVATRLQNPHISLLDALLMGGFEYPSNKHGVLSDRRIVDSDNVSLFQRKNQLCRRLRHVKKKQLAAKARKERSSQMQGESSDTAPSTQDGVATMNDERPQSRSDDIKRAPEMIPKIIPKDPSTGRAGARSKADDMHEQESLVESPQKKIANENRLIENHATTSNGPLEQESTSAQLYNKSSNEPTGQQIHALGSSQRPITIISNVPIDQHSQSIGSGPQPITIISNESTVQDQVRLFGNGTQQPFTIISNRPAQQFQAVGNLGLGHQSIAIAPNTAVNQHVQVLRNNHQLDGNLPFGGSFRPGQQQPITIISNGVAQQIHAQQPIAIISNNEAVEPQLQVTGRNHHLGHGQQPYTAISSARIADQIQLLRNNQYYGQQPYIATSNGTIEQQMRGSVGQPFAMAPNRSTDQQIQAANDPRQQQQQQQQQLYTSRGSIQNAYPQQYVLHASNQVSYPTTDYRSWNQPQGPSQNMYPSSGPAYLTRDHGGDGRSGKSAEPSSQQSSQE